MNSREQGLLFWGQQLQYLHPDELRQMIKQGSIESYLEQKLSPSQMKQVRFFFLKQCLLQAARESGYLGEEQCRSMLQEKLKIFREGIESFRLKAIEREMVSIEFFKKVCEKLYALKVFTTHEVEIFSQALSFYENMKTMERTPPTPPAPEQEKEKSAPPDSPGAVCTNQPSSQSPVKLGDTVQIPPEKKVLQAGDRLGHYHILEEIGSGGMGKVYKARDEKLGRIVAIKVLHATDSGNEKDRFLAEARVTAKLRHPNIVTVHEINSEGGINYIVMDFIDGETLETILKRPRFSLRKGLKALKDVSQAIDHAHQHQIIHRDLKPANILIDRSSGQTTITDFGIAKEIMGEDSKLTQVGQILGTPQYIAPEQASGKREAISPRTDVYSLGTILYEMLTGCPSVEGETPMDMICNILHEEIIPPRKRDPKIPVELEKICLKALEKDPARRYPNAKSLARDLERYLSGKGGKENAPPKSGVARLSFFLFLLVLAGLCIFLVIRAIFPHPEESPRVGLVEKPVDAPKNNGPQNQTGPKVTEEDPSRRLREEELRQEKEAQLHLERTTRKFENKDFRGAIEECNQAIAIHPKSKKGYNNRGSIYLHLGNFQQAIQDFNIAIQIAPDFSVAYFNRGRAYIAMGNFHAAMADLDKAIAIDPNFPESRFHRGIAFVHSGDMNRAIAEWTKTIELHPGHAMAYSHRAIGYTGLEEFEKASNDCERAIQLAPRLYHAYYSRAYLSWKKKEMRQALEDFTTAVRLNPMDRFSYLGRGNVYKEVGKHDLAIVDFRQYLKLWPNAPEAQPILAYIKEHETK